MTATGRSTGCSTSPSSPRRWALNATIGEIKGEVDPNLGGRLQSSVDDRNWDSIEALWQMKEEIKGDKELDDAFRHRGETAKDVLGALEGSERGRQFLAERIEPYQQEFGYRAIWSHEFAFPTWKETKTPTIEALRGYVETDYDYPATIAAVKEDLEAAVAELMDACRGRGPGAASGGARPLAPHEPAHARPSLLHRPGNERAPADPRGGDRPQAGRSGPPRRPGRRDLPASTTSFGSSWRTPTRFDARSLVSDRRDERERAYTIRPREWVGTATQTALDFPYNALWGFPEKFYREAPKTTGDLQGLAASPGIAEGTARYVGSLDDFDQVQKGEILICQMTNPAWVVLFTKIAGLVTDAGGAVSHPAVVAREFGIPAVVGTSNATERIKTGDRVRVNGATGVVEILA